MKGDFSRDTFDPAKHFTRVLMQQGRVTLDADYNEQSGILLHYLRALARDLIGPYAAPADNRGFLLSPAENGANLAIGAGRCYVHGLLVENERDCLYCASRQADGDVPPAQPHLRIPDDDDFLNMLRQDSPSGRYWVYLDVWERHVTFVEDDTIRETALGGPDTCTRAQTVWQVRAMAVTQIAALLEEQCKHLHEQAGPNPNPENRSRLEHLRHNLAVFRKAADSTPIPVSGCAPPLDLLPGLSDASLAARVDPGEGADDPQIKPPQSHYRGTENHLYRVEIHQGGKAGQEPRPTFKWSRDNGSIVTRWLGTSGSVIQVANGRGFAPGNWIELSDDAQELQGLPGVLCKLVKVEGEVFMLDTATAPPAWSQSLVHPKARRWDYVQTEAIQLARDNALPMVETPARTMPGTAAWIDLENGIQVQFAARGTYRTGDYWLIPARVATANIEWPVDEQGEGIAQPPRGIEHHYAPLGFVWWGDGMQILSCDCIFLPLRSCASNSTQQRM